MSVSTPPEHHLTLNRLATIARLVAGAAHEVNNALQVIGGSAELLQNRTDLPEPVQKTLSRIRDQATRAASAMTGVVALSRAQPERAMQLVVPSMPQLVSGHQLHLLQAALNMIQNAEQALAPRRSGCIRVAVVEDGDSVVLRVSDDGPGVAPADAERIFHPFVTSMPRPESTGLGLPVAREIAAAHRGSLELETVPTGASFRLRVPKAKS